VKTEAEMNAGKEKFKKMLEIIGKNPGLDAAALKDKGYRPSSHGSLRDAGNLDIITFVDGGWYLVNTETGEVLTS